MIAPTLLVGLGGTGSKIVCRVSKMVTEEQRRHIGFAVFDTDINELREIREENPFIRTIQTSTKLTVGEYLNIDTHARDTWFPRERHPEQQVADRGRGAGESDLKAGARHGDPRRKYGAAAQCHRGSL